MFFNLSHRPHLETDLINLEPAPASKVELRVFPVAEPTLAPQGRAAEVDAAIPVFEDPDVPANDEVFAPRAKPGFLQRPPLFVRVAQLEELELAAGSERQGGQHDARKVYLPDGGGNAPAAVAERKRTGPICCLRAGEADTPRVLPVPPVTPRVGAGSDGGGAFRAKLRAC